MEFCMTPYDQHQAALVELKKARQKCSELKRQLTDLESVVEFKKANAEVIHAAELCTYFANQLAVSEQ
jgi:hypothetical protein